MDDFEVSCMLYNIIVCDDNDRDLDIITHLINSYFNKKVNFDCKIHSFHDYNNDFINFIYNNRLPNMVCLLDIETPSGNGFDMTRKIKNIDPNTPVIYITGYYKKFSKVALSTCDMDGYINKFLNLNNELENKFDKILERKGQKYLFNIKRDDTNYTIDARDVNYFTTGDKNQVKVVGSNYPSLYISMSILYKQLDHRFIKTHQSCIVNFDNVKEFYIKTKIIYFHDGTSTNLIARDFATKNIDWLCEHYRDKIIFK